MARGSGRPLAHVCVHITVAALMESVISVPCHTTCSVQAELACEPGVGKADKDM